MTSHPRKEHVGQNDSQLGHNFKANETEIMRKKGRKQYREKLFAYTPRINITLFIVVILFQGYCLLRRRYEEIVGIYDE